MYFNITYLEVSLIMIVELKAIKISANRFIGNIIIRSITITECGTIIVLQRKENVSIYQSTKIQPDDP